MLRPRAEIADVPASVADALLASETRPFIVPQEVAAQVPIEHRLLESIGHVPPAEYEREYHRLSEAQAMAA
mgnify:CR=1 FL=1